MKLLPIENFPVSLTFSREGNSHQYMIRAPQGFLVELY